MWKRWQIDGEWFYNTASLANFRRKDQVGHFNLEVSYTLLYHANCNRVVSSID